LTKWNDEELLSEEQAQKVARFWPHIQKTWWFFIAKIRKIAPLEQRPYENKLVWKRVLKFEDWKKVQNKIKKFLQDNYWIQVDENKHYFIETKNYVFVTSPAFEKVKWNFDVEKIWIPILKKNNRNDLRPTHHFGIIFWHLANNNIIEIDSKSAQKYALGNDLNPDEFKIINIENPIMNYVVIKYKKWWIWVGKYLNGGIKNKYIK
jgi:NOL1/NOP2/fmu family ribosome biogenesis protein